MSARLSSGSAVPSVVTTFPDYQPLWSCDELLPLVGHPLLLGGQPLWLGIQPLLLEFQALVLGSQPLLLEGHPRMLEVHSLVLDGQAALLGLYATALISCLYFKGQISKCRICFKQTKLFPF